MPEYATDLPEYSIYMCLNCTKIFRSRAKIPKCPVKECKSIKVVLASEVPKEIYRFEEVSKLRLEHEVLEHETEQHLKTLYMKMATMEAQIQGLLDRQP